MPFLYPEEGSTLISKDKKKGHQEEPKQNLLGFLQFTTLTSYSLPYHISIQLSTFNQTWYKNTQSESFLQIFITL